MQLTWNVGLELATGGVKVFRTDSSSLEHLGRGHRQNYCCWFTASPVGVSARGAPTIWTGSLTRSEMKCDTVYIIVECNHVHNNASECLKAKYRFSTRRAIWAVINHLWYANEGRCYHRTWRVIATCVKGTITALQTRDYKDSQQITMACAFSINKRPLMTCKSLIHNYNRQ